MGRARTAASRIGVRPAVLLVGWALVFAACAGQDEVRGIVLEVDGDLTSVESFVLRLDDGEILTIVPAATGGDFHFPLPHLSDHRTSLSPVIVELDRSVDPPRAVMIRDADTVEWHE